MKSSLRQNIGVHANFAQQQPTSVKFEGKKSSHVRRARCAPIGMCQVNLTDTAKEKRYYTE